MPSGEAARTRGFTYIGLLVVVFVLGLALASAGQTWSIAAQREKEKELLFAGQQFRQALAAYRENSPGGQQNPKNLEDLLEDRRYPDTRRYLRQVYIDPMAGTREWGLVMDPAGGIAGVYSQSKEKPLKIANFEPTERAFEGKTRYSDWKFQVIGAEVPPAPKAQPAPSPGAAAAPAPAASSAPPPAVESAPRTAPRPAEKRVCETLRRNDRNACSDPSGVHTRGDIAACESSAAARHAYCLEPSGPGMPALNVPSR